MKYGVNAQLTRAMVEDATDGFSPCPMPIIEIIKTWVVPSTNGGTLLDSCAGDGTAAHSLAQAWGLRPILVEPHPVRHALCLRYDSGAVMAPAQNVIGRGPTAWFFNPPYDPADETCSMEMHLLWSTVSRVPAPLTFCVWLLPLRMLEVECVTDLLAQKLERLRLFAFPKPGEDYRQIVIMGYWVEQHAYFPASKRLLSQVSLADIPRIEAAHHPYSLRAVGANFGVRAQASSPYEENNHENFRVHNLAKGTV